MKGWLVVNCFVKSEKFNELYKLLVEAFLKEEVELEVVASDILVNDISQKFKNNDLPDFVLFWDKDVYLAKRIEYLGIPVFNSSKSIELCDNKILTYLELTKKGIKIPKTIIAPKTFENVKYNKRDFVETATIDLGFPMIIKEAYGSFGEQVYLVNSLEEANSIVDKIGSKDFLFQEFIETSKGRDVRVNVVGGKAVASMLRKNDNDFRSNITSGGQGYPYELNDKQRKIAVEASKALGLDFGGVDIIFGRNDDPIICEVNSNPHFKSMKEFTGIDVASIIAKYIKNKISKFI